MQIQALAPPSRIRDLTHPAEFAEQTGKIGRAAAAAQ
jgi:hypothetical protein